MSDIDNIINEAFGKVETRQRDDLIGRAAHIIDLINEQMETKRTVDERLIELRKELKELSIPEINRKDVTGE